MRVLMFGWEFPPYKSGGLGTACYGMGRALAAAMALDREHPDEIPSTKGVL